MAIVIEDGTGLSNAQSYCDYAFYHAFVTEMGLQHSHSEEQTEPALVTASKRWIDWQHEFTGDKLVETQALEFPRDNDIGLPLKIKQAAAYGAWLHLRGLLPVGEAAISKNGNILSVRKKLDVMETETTYDDGSKNALPPELNDLLSAYLKQSTGFGRVVRLL